MTTLDTATTRDPSLDLMIRDIERLETVFQGWDDTQRRAVETYVNAIEALQGEAIRRLIRSLNADPSALATLKQALADEVVYTVLRRHGIVKPSLNECVETALATVRPMLAAHGGDVELISVEPPAIEVRFVGSCDGCPASVLTFHAGVKKAVQDACPEISEIREVKGSHSATYDKSNYISPFTMPAVGNWQAAGTLGDIPEGGIRTLELGGEKLLLWRRGAVVSCLQNECAHMGFPIDAGEIKDGIITCPHHRFQYDLVSGGCLTTTQVRLQAHVVRVTGDLVEVRLAK